jgi:anti-sigma B factor antagonist/stage II sporulation protein AA (anti-sigma F factor antagonist)
MQLGARCHAEVVLASPQGRIDHASVSAFEQALAPLLAQTGSGGALVLDLSQLEYISSVGLRVLMLAAKQTRAVHGALAVAALQPVVREIFDISRFTLVLMCYPDVREALSALAPGALASYGAS